MPRTKIYFYIIGNNQAGGAQHSFLKEASVLTKNPNSIVYFISAKATSYQISKDIITDGIIRKESNNLLNANIINIFLYFKYLYLLLKCIRNKNRDAEIIVSYTTPLASLIAATVCKCLRIRSTRYRIGGLLYSPNFTLYLNLPAFLIEYTILRLSKYTSFVCDSNKIKYLKIFKFLRSKIKYIDVFYSVCSQEINYNEDKILRDNKYLYNLNSNKKINFNDYLKSKRIILTIINDKLRKGSHIFYKITRRFENDESLLFIHLGSRKHKNPTLINKNMLIIPHSSSNDVFYWIDKCIFTVILSKYPEGLAQVIPQSISKGKPVLAFQNSGVNDCIICGFNGVILDNQSDLNLIYMEFHKLIYSSELSSLTSNALKSSEFFKHRHSESNFRTSFMNSNFYKNCCN